VEIQANPSVDGEALDGPLILGEQRQLPEVLAPFSDGLVEDGDLEGHAVPELVTHDVVVDGVPVPRESPLIIDAEFRRMAARDVRHRRPGARHIPGQFVVAGR